MISGIGIDSVEISRCAHWHNYHYTRLSRVFSDEEINYCLSNNLKSAERFAARFAAKEAFYKAASSLGTQEPFLKIAKYIEVQHEAGRPVLQIKRDGNGVHPAVPAPSKTQDKLRLGEGWECFCTSKNINGVHPECFCVSKNVSKDQASNQLKLHLSLTHTKTTATAVVIIEKT